MRDWTELGCLERDGFDIIVEKSWEDLHPKQCFEEDDVAEICEKIDNNTYDWFLLRVRVLLAGHELAEEYLGGCLYEDAREVLTDGTAEDLIYQAIPAAREEARRLVGFLQKVVDTSDDDS